MKYVIAVRGEKWCFDKFISELSAKWWPFLAKKKINPDGKPDKKKRIYAFQTGVQPIQLFAVNFPKEHEEAMKATLFNEPRYKSDSKKLYSKITYPIRKLLGLKPIDMTTLDPKKAHAISHDFVQVFPIGKIEATHIKNKDNDYENL